MERTNVSTEIYIRIQKNKEGGAFVASDFLDMGEYKAVSKALERLEDEHKIRRIIRGVYDCPHYSKLLEEYEAPSPHYVALAIARNNNWTIAPNGNTALNQLGLSTQVTANWSYITNGPYKKYLLNGQAIEFKHRNNKEISGKSYKTALVIQALKELGEKFVTEKHIKIIRRGLTDMEKKVLLREGQQTTTWIYSVIKKICERQGDYVRNSKTS
jgi:hypothetical protein